MSGARFLLGSLAYSTVVVALTHWMLARVDDPTATAMPERARSACADCVISLWLLAHCT